MFAKYAFNIVNALSMRTTQSSHTCLLACVLVLSSFALTNCRSLHRRSSSEYQLWDSPCNNHVTMPHVTNHLSKIISNMGPSTPSESETLDLAQRLRQNLMSTSELVHYIVNQTEKKLANSEHINQLKGEPAVQGLRRIRDVSQVREMEVRPLVEEMYHTLIRVAIFLDSIRTDIENLRFKSDDENEMLELLTTLEQGGPWAGSDESHYGIYNQLCEIERNHVRGHNLSDDIIPEEHAPTSNTQAEARDRNFRILNSIHRTLLDLAQNAMATLP